MKKNLIYFFILVLVLISSTLFLIQEISKDKSEYLTLSIIISAAVVGFSTGLFIKRYSFLDFLKILLPTSGTLIAAIWLLSSGYLNIRSENLKREISDLEKKKIILQERSRAFQMDSLRISEENDSLSTLNKLLRQQVNNNSQIKIDNAKLTLENSKLRNEIKLNDTIQKITRQKQIKNISNIAFENRKVYFKIKDLKGRILDKTEIGIEYYYGKTRKFVQLEFNSKTNQYLWNIPNDLFDEEVSNIEFNFSFINSSLSAEQITEFRKNNQGFKIAPFGAKYELIVFL